MKKKVSRRDFLKGCAAGSAAVASVAVLGACSSSSEDEEVAETEEVVDAGTEGVLETDAVATDDGGEPFVVYDAGDDEDLYFANLGDFYDLYEPISTDYSLDTDERYVGEAIAEAKFLESGCCPPFAGKDANYAMTKYAYRTGDYTTTGLDANRKWNMLITNEPILTEDDTHLRELWSQLHGTGTYRAEAKAYLEEQGYTFTDTYYNSFQSTPNIWDAVGANSDFDVMPIVESTCPLLEYDGEGVQQPALATGYDESDDHMTYTFYIRQGCKWVDVQGREIADITADDWVAGLQHVMDSENAQQISNVCAMIEGASDYNDGVTVDFNDVGVHAVDEYTLEYDLAWPCPYFLSLIGTQAFLPLCRSYYESQGGTFGKGTSDRGSYGTTYENIAYCGPFLVSSVVDKNSMNFSQNLSYWNADNVAIKQIIQPYDNGDDPTTSYTDFLNGTNADVTLTGARLEMAKQDGNFDLYATIGDVGTNSGLQSFNLGRTIWQNSVDAGCKSTQTDEQKELAHAAVNNKHFRLAMAYAFDRGTYYAISVGDDLKYASLRNSFVPGDYVILSNDVTTEIDGESVTFAAGTNYGEIVQTVVDMDGYPFKVWDYDEKTGDAFDGWYNPDMAKAEMQEAIADLESLGYEITSANPIVIDKVCSTYSDSGNSAAYAYKQMIDGCFDGLVILNVVGANDDNEYNYACNRIDSGAEANFDICFEGGTRPNFLDPSAYLDYYLPYYDGGGTIYMGLW